MTSRIWRWRDFCFGCLAAACLTTLIALLAGGCHRSDKSTPNSGPNEGSTARGEEAPTSRSGAVALADDSADGEDFTKTRSGHQPAGDDVLRLVFKDDPNTLNLIISDDGVSTEFQGQVYEPLAQRKFENPEEWEPMLATSWEFDEETLTYTIHLRKGVYWHPIKLPSGRMAPKAEFTANDVLFTLNTILNDQVNAKHLRSYYVDADGKPMITVSKADKHTVNVKWLKPYFLALSTTLSTAIMPRHIYGTDENGEPITLDFRNSEDFAETFNTHWANDKMCGTGPLIFQEWRKEEYATLVRNPHYWGHPFYFSRVHFQHIANPNTIYHKIMNNDLDSGPLIEKQQYIEAKKSDRAAEGKVILYTYSFPSYRYIGYNSRQPFLHERGVRQALSHATPVEQIMKEVFYGLAERVNGPFMPGSPFNDETLPLIKYDLEKARQLLDEAGWIDTDGDAVRDKVVEGRKVQAKFDLMVFSDSPAFQTTAEIYKENLRQIGVEVQVTPTKWTLMLEKLNKKDFEAAMLGWAARSWEEDPFRIWHSSQADLQGSSNAIGYKNKKVDELIEKLRVTMGEVKQMELYHLIHREIYVDQPCTFLFNELVTEGRHARLKGVKCYRIRPNLDLREWYANESRPWN